jgi:uncharacterized protein
MRSAFDDAAVIDTSAALALHDPRDQFHKLAIQQFTQQIKDLFWVVFDVTTHETYTRARYWQSFQAAMEHYNFLRQDTFRLIRFSPNDERDAERLLAKYAEHALSYHDALCAAMMLRLGIYKIFSFDSDFRILGFQVIPGPTG